MEEEPNAGIVLLSMLASGVIGLLGFAFVIGLLLAIL